jgi:hypothetical protein
MAWLPLTWMLRRSLRLNTSRKGKEGIRSSQTKGKGYDHDGNQSASRGRRSLWSRWRTWFHTPISTVTRDRVLDLSDVA